MIFSVGRRVIILITPPIASEPYKVEPPPGKTSTLSILLVVISERSKPPEPKLFIGLPSSKIKTCPVLEPRIN